MNFDILVPITFLIVVYLIVQSLFSHRDRRRGEVHQTLRTALQAGERVAPDVLARLAVSADPRRADLRKSIVLTVVAILIAGLSVLMPFPQPAARSVVLGLALVPGVLAATYFGFWMFWYRGANVPTDR